MSTDTQGVSAEGAADAEPDTEPDTEASTNTGIRNFRPNCIIVRPPGIDDEAARFAPEQTESLAEFFETELNRQNLAGVELLAESRAEAVTYYISPQMAYADDKARLNATNQTSLDSFTETSVVPENTLESIAADLDAYLSNGWEIALGSVDLGPIGGGPVIGTRFLLEENRGMTDPEYTNVKLFEALVDQLHLSQKPFVVQTILRETSKGYQYTGRFAIPFPTHSLVSIEDKIEHIKTGRNFDVSTITEAVGVVTNHDVPVGDFASAYRSSISLKRRNYLERSDSKRALELHRGVNEFGDLLRGRRGSDTLYGRLKRYGVISIDEFRLAHVGALVPRYYSVSPWEHVFGRSHSRLDIHKIIREGEGTLESLGTDVDAPVDAASLGILEGSLSHDALCRFSKVVLPRDHEAVTAVEVLLQESGESKPDLLITANDAIVNGEVEVENKSKGAKTVNNYVKALESGRDVWFIVGSVSDAESYRDIMVRPWNNTLDDGALLYTTNRKVTLDNGLKPVLPPGVNEARWVLRGKTLTLKTGEGEVLGTGTATEPIENIEFSTPLYESGSTHRIIDTDGQTITDGPTKSAVLEEYTEISIPRIPPAPYLTEGVKFFVKNGDTLEEYPLDMDDLQDGRSSDIYREGLNQFCETYLVTGEDAEMPYSEFQTHVQAFFDAFAEETPNKTHIGRNLPPGFEVDEPTVNDRMIYADWAVDPDLDSPI